MKKIKQNKECPHCGKLTYVVSIFGSICSSCFYEPPKAQTLNGEPVYGIKDGKLIKDNPNLDNCQGGEVRCTCSFSDDTAAEIGHYKDCPMEKIDLRYKHTPQPDHSWEGRYVRLTGTAGTLEEQIDFIKFLLKEERLKMAGEVEKICMDTFSGATIREHKELGEFYKKLDNLLKD
jgi:hypothetical protein